MLLLLLPLLLLGCVDEFPVPTEVPYGGDGKGLSVEEAKTFFESYVSGKASRSAGPDEHDNGFYIRRKGINWSGKTYVITQIRPNK